MHENHTAEISFEVMKEALTSAPFLRFPDFSFSFVLVTDVSQYALEAVLAQEFEDQEHPIAYASRQVYLAERKYGVTDLEGLAVVSQWWGSLPLSSLLVWGEIEDSDRLPGS